MAKLWGLAPRRQEQSVDDGDPIVAEQTTFSCFGVADAARQGDDYRSPRYGPLLRCGAESCGSLGISSPAVYRAMTESVLSHRYHEFGSHITTVLVRLDGVLAAAGATVISSWLLPPEAVRML
jgi:hypothetical protein